MSKNCVKWKYFISNLCQMQCIIEQKFAFKNSGNMCLALIFNLSNLRMTILQQKTSCRLWNTEKKYAVFIYRVTWTHSLMDKVSSSECGGSGLIPVWCWNLLPLLVALSQSVHWHKHFSYCCTLYNFFSWISSVAISPWQGFNSEDEHQTSTGLEHLEWAHQTSTVLEHFRLGVGPGAQTRPHVQAWRMGVIIAIVEPQSRSQKSAWLLFFLKLWKIFENNGPHWGFFNPHPPHWWGPLMLQLLQSYLPHCQPVQLDPF